MAKRRTTRDLEETYTASNMLRLLHEGYTAHEIAEMMTRSHSSTQRWIRDNCGLTIPNKSRTDAYALMCHEYGLNAAEYSRASYRSQDRTQFEPIRYTLLNGQELVFQPGRVRSSRYFLGRDFLDRTLPLGFSATLFQRICKGHTVGKALEFYGTDGQMEWLIENNSKPMHHIYKLITGKIQKEWG